MVIDRSITSAWKLVSVASMTVSGAFGSAAASGAAARCRPVSGAACRAPLPAGPGRGRRRTGQRREVYRS
ncbi:hypothetical protein [Fodinicola feengrottensis]|uniref:hypothetical protein n=1 Tax=Fodinicola feengrottensis TaxID=435914 RepID=UPI00244173F2|nr:hypothetical protein [Fodinicola feengrottensis]